MVSISTVRESVVKVAVEVAGLLPGYCSKHLFYFIAHETTPFESNVTGFNSQ